MKLMLLIFLSIFSRNPDECRIVDRNFVPLIRAEIEGKEFFFILDTGSSISIIDFEKLKREFPNKNLGRKLEGTAKGLGGVASDFRGVNVKVSAGNVRFDKDWQASHIRHISIAVENRTGYRIMGIIGNNNLRDKIIDLKNKRIYYSRD